MQKSARLPILSCEYIGWVVKTAKFFDIDICFKFEPFGLKLWLRTRSWKKKLSKCKRPKSGPNNCHPQQCNPSVVALSTHTSKTLYT